MAEVFVHQTILPSGRYALDYAWRGAGPVVIAADVIALSDEWHGPRPPFPGAWGQLGPYRLRCIGYDAVRRQYTFERMP